MLIDTSRRVIFIVAVVLVVVSLGGLIAGIAGNDWFNRKEENNDPEEHYFGLYSSCKDTRNEILTCRTRDKILQFSGNSEWLAPLHLDKGSIYFDTIMIILIIALFFDVLALIIVIVGLLGSDETLWRGRLLAGLAASIIAGCIAFAAVGYAEHIYKENLPSYNHGWSLILVWVGAAALILAVIVLLSGYFFIKDLENRAEKNLSPDVWRVRSQSERQRQYENQGYERNELNVRTKQPIQKTHTPYQTNGYQNRSEKTKTKDSTYNSYRDSQTENSKHEFSSVSSMQPKFIYEENKKNNRYKYSYNPESMEQKYRHHETPPTSRHKSPPSHHRPEYSPPRRDTSRYSQSPRRRERDYSPSPDRSYNREARDRNYYRESPERSYYKESLERSSYDESPPRSYYYRPGYDNEGYEIR